MKASRAANCARDLDPKLAHRYIRDAIWVAVRWYRPGGRLSSSQLADQYLTLMLDGMRASERRRLLPYRTKRSLG